MNALRGSYPLRLLARVLDVPRSSLYYRKKARSDEPLRERLRVLARTWPRYGYRRLGVLLRGEGFSVGDKKVRALMRQEGLLVPRRAAKPRTTLSLGRAKIQNRLKGLSLTRVNQVWVADLSYVRTGEGFAYLALIMDLLTRRVVGFALGPRITKHLTLSALDMALEGGRPEIHHSDQGVQYTSRRYVARLLELGVALSYAGVGRAWENGHVERLIRTVKEEWLDLREYGSLAEARACIEAFVLDVYNRRRPHSALGYLTPEAFAEKFSEVGEGLTDSGRKVVQNRGALHAPRLQGNRLRRRRRRAPSAAGDDRRGEEAQGSVSLRL